MFRSRIAVLVALLPSVTLAASDLQAVRTEVAPQLDGVLDDPIWREAQPIELSYETDPAENVPASVRTLVWATYDRTTLYFAFRAYDPEPAAVRAFYSDRDRIVREDAVGVILDPFGDQRRGFGFLANPLGVQFDMTVDGNGNPGVGPFAFTGASREDWSWDAIWSSIGRIDDEGFAVEFAIPFTSLRFPRSDQPQTWGFSAVRGRPRSVRQRFQSHPYDRSRNCSLCQFGQLEGLSGIAPGRDFELDPTITAAHSRLSASSPDREDSDQDGEVGLTARWGITPNLIFGAALNPDFSQIEADALQIAVNTRFALFFDEKRPFFQEGADFFSTPIQAVYTRTVVDPEVGLKLTGKEGAHALGVFVTRDADTSLLLPSNQGSAVVRLRQRENTAAVLRWRRDLGANSNVGLLLTGRDGEDYRHYSGGVDAAIFLSPTDSLGFQHLRSSNDYPSEIVQQLNQPRKAEGHATYLRYNHSSRDWFAQGTLARTTPGFRADTGFVNRVDVRSASGSAGLVRWGAADAFWNRVQYSVSGEVVEDDDGQLTDRNYSLAAQLNGRLQTFWNLSLNRRREVVALGPEQRVGFDLNYLQSFTNVRWNGRLTSSIDLLYGDAIDFSTARDAKIWSVNPEATLNLGRHFFIGGEYTVRALESEQGREFDLDQIDGKIAWQFNTRSFVRLLVQRTSVEFEQLEKVDDRYLELLFSYKVNPFTVIFVGASDCDRCRALPGPEGLDFLPEHEEKIFIKLGYAWQL